MQECLRKCLTLGKYPVVRSHRPPARSAHRSGRTHRRQIRRRALVANASISSALQNMAAQAATSNPGIPTGTATNSLVYILGIKILLKGLTPAGVLHSWFLGSTIYSAFGPAGYLLVCLYFILGSVVTKIKLAEKQKEGIAEARSGRRSIGSVWGSGFAGMVCGIAALSTGNQAFWQIGFVASFVSKLSDTVSSEIGKAYGRTTYLITTLKQVPRGTEGAISLEGTLAGVAASFLFAAIALATGLVSIRGVAVVALASTVANIFESYLGALVQGRISWLSNDVVNITQISFAAGLAIYGRLLLDQ